MTKKEKGKNKKEKTQALEKLHIRFTDVGQHITGGQIPKDKKNVCKPAWKEDGSKCIDATSMKKTSKETLDILQRVLNKITPERFGCLIQQVKCLKINTEERLKGAIELILDKAASEPAYCATYARLFRYLVGMKMNSESGDAALEFLKLLLRRCQQEILKDINDDKAFISKQKELDAAQNQDECQRLESEVEAMKTRAHRRCLSLIRFIGELFKLQMLKEFIMHDCIYKLLDDCVEESFKCLCKLLPTCGKQLDTEEAKPRMDQYFSYIDYIIQEGEVSCRVKFLLKGLVELRLNNWEPREPERGPRTLRKIHQEQVRKKGELIHVHIQEGEAHRAAEDANSRRKAPESSWRRTSEYLHLTDVNMATPQMRNVQCKRQQDPTEELKNLLQQRKTNRQITDWIQENLDDKQISSSVFVRALMSAVCKSVIIVCDVPKINCPEMLKRSGLLKTFLTDQDKQLEALDALQELTDTMEHSHNLMWMFLDILWDEDIFSETIFFKWEHHRSTKGGIGSSGQFFSRIRRVMETVIGTHF